MSYRNPQIFTADPTAFAKGFQTTFDAFQKKFEDEKQRKKELADKADLAEAMALRKSDLSAFQKIDAQLMKSFQSGIDEIIQTDRFKNASKADQERMIREVSYTKGTIGKINEMLSIDNDNWDIRNDDAISELRNAMLTGDESVQISGGGLDMAISFKNDKGELKTVTLADIANTNFRLTEDYKDELEKFDNDFIKNAEAYYKESVALGVDPKDIKDSLFEIYKKDLKSDRDLLSYAYSNELDPSMQVHSVIYGDDRFSPEGKDQQVNEQFEAVGNFLAQRALDRAYDRSPLLQATRDKIERDKKRSSGSGSGSGDVEGVVDNFFQMVRNDFSTFATAATGTKTTYNNRTGEVKAVDSEGKSYTYDFTKQDGSRYTLYDKIFDNVLKDRVPKGTDVKAVKDLFMRRVQESEAYVKDDKPFTEGRAPDSQTTTPTKATTTTETPSEPNVSQENQYPESFNDLSTEPTTREELFGLGQGLGRSGAEKAILRELEDNYSSYTEQNLAKVIYDSGYKNSITINGKTYQTKNSINKSNQEAKKAAKALEDALKNIEAKSNDTITLSQQMKYSKSDILSVLGVDSLDSLTNQDIALYEIYKKDKSLFEEVKQNFEERQKFAQNKIII